VKYVNAYTKIIIICSEHGEFLQKPTRHLGGHECPKCSGFSLNTEEFIFRSRKIHEDKYDYSKVDYVKVKDNVVIICPEHGEFEQKPRNHLRGKGCSKCHGFNLNYLSLKEAKIIIQPIMLSLKESLGKKNLSIADYTKWWNDNKEYCKKIGLPKYPDDYYKRHK